MKPICCLLFLAAFAGSVTAGTLTFQNSTLATAPGGTVTFVATYTNTSGATENLNSASLSLATPLTFDDSDFFNTWPLSLDTGLSFGPSDLFTATVPLGTAGGPYVGTFNLLGGPGANDLNVLGSAQFTVNVVPEPGTWALAALGLGVAMLRLRKGKPSLRN